jgi:hypothetical protein
LEPADREQTSRYAEFRQQWPGAKQTNA